MKLKHDKLLSNFAFNCNLRHYNEGIPGKKYSQGDRVCALVMAVEEQTWWGRGAVQVDPGLTAVDPS